MRGGGEQVPLKDPMKRMNYLMNFRMACQGIHNEVEDLEFASVSEDPGDHVFSSLTAALAQAIARKCSRREARQPSERNKQSQSSKCRRRESRGGEESLSEPGVEQRSGLPDCWDTALFPAKT